MQFSQINQGYKYENNGWVIEITDGREGLFFQIKCTLINDYVFNSGINLDELSDLIIFSKNHATSNGLNWSNN
jgi:hypothetical protein